MGAFPEINSCISLTFKWEENSIPAMYVLLPPGICWPKQFQTPTRSSRRSRGRGKPRGSTSRRRGSDSEFDDFLDDDDDDEDNYVPRPSKRRAPAKRKKKETDSEEESEEDIRPKKKSKQKRRPDSSEEERPKKRRRTKRISDDEDDEEEEDKPKKRKRRRLCRFGEKCYRFGIWYTFLSSSCSCTSVAHLLPFCCYTVEMFCPVQEKPSSP